VQALEDSICAAFLVCFVEAYRSRFSVARNGIAGRATNSHYTPQSQLRTFTARTAMPVRGATPASAFFRTGFPVREAVAAITIATRLATFAIVPVKRLLDGVEAGVKR